MAFETLNGIVLRYADYRDNDRIFTLLTKERGLVSVTSRGLRSKSGAASCGVKDVYCYGEFVVYDRNRIEYVSASSVTEAFYPIREDYDKLLAAAKMAHIAEIIAQAHASDELFSLVYYALSFIAYGEAEAEDILLCFLAKCMVFAGYGPVITSCVSCGKSVLTNSSISFSNSQGGSLCDDCARGEKRFSPITLEAFRRMLLLEDNAMDRVRLPEKARQELRELLFDYAEYVLERPIRLKKGKSNAEG